MHEIARHRLALRDPTGARVEVAPGEALPAWVTESTRTELQALGSVDRPAPPGASEPPEAPPAPDVKAPDVPPRRASRSRATPT